MPAFMRKRLAVLSSSTIKYSSFLIICRVFWGITSSGAISPRVDGIR